METYLLENPTEHDQRLMELIVKALAMSGYTPAERYYRAAKLRAARAAITTMIKALETEAEPESAAEKGSK